MLMLRKSNFLMAAGPYEPEPRGVNISAMKDGLVADFSFVWLRISATATVILILSGFSLPRCGATVYQFDGSVPSVQPLHNAAHDGDTITLPAGTFTGLHV
jgi:hypothetical protein